MSFAEIKMTAGRRAFRKEMRGSFGDVRFEVLIRNPSERDNCIIGCKREVHRKVLTGDVQSI